MGVIYLQTQADNLNLRKMFVHFIT